MSTTTSTNSRRVPLDKRKRTETSCDKCKSRKQKCQRSGGLDGGCRYCRVHGIECLTTQPRKKRLYGSVEGLGHRLALLESLVKGVLPEADVSSMDDLRRVGGSLGIPLPDSPRNSPLFSEGEGEGDGGGNGGGNGEGIAVSLLPDQQGQAQYIGPASSLAFHLSLRALAGQGQGAAREFVLFGRNAAEMAETTDRQGYTTCDALLTAFFDNINPDFPVLHEAEFRGEYERSVANPDNMPAAWTCSLLCVLLLARRVVGCPVEHQERIWWSRVQSCLPHVVFTSSVAAVQALMLAALHLHNTNHRDACWTLTGTAIRIAVGIGLHQDKVNTMQMPLTRELRKRLWWTLYAFEQMQLSSYDRPSAIEHPAPKIACPNERIMAAGHSPPEYWKWSNRLVLHLGSACRAPKNVKQDPTDDSYLGPLSPAANVLRDLHRWKDGLPAHLRLEAVAASPVSFQRPLLLLHAKFHYTAIVLCRAALLARATANPNLTNANFATMADACADSGRALAQVLLDLDEIGKFDPITWWDVWFTLASASILLLEYICSHKRDGGEGNSESRVLLSRLAHLATKHRKNPHMPGTIDKFASLVPELQSMADSLQEPTSEMRKNSLDTQAEPHGSTTRPPPRPSDLSSQPLRDRHQHSAMYPLQSSPSSGAYLFAENLSVPSRMFPEPDFPPHQTGVARYDRSDKSTQNSFMDFTVNSNSDWNWADLGLYLGTEGVHPPHGPAS